MKSIYVCYATSDLFAEPTCVSLLSLLYNSVDVTFKKVFILDYGLESTNKQRLKKVGLEYHVDVEFIRSKEILESKRDQLGLTDFQGSMATYSRAFIDLIIPEYVDELIYIDSDTIVVDSIKELAEYNLEDKVMAAAVGVNQYRYKNEPINKELELLTGNKIYFACGVVKYSLKNWRANHCINLICDTCKRLHTFPYADQTVINNAIPERLIGRFSNKFNSWLHELPICYGRKELSRGSILTEDEITEALNHPVIHHYKGEYYRPWYIESISRENEPYRFFREKLPWTSGEYAHLPNLASPDKRKRTITKASLKIYKRRNNIKNMLFLRVFDFLSRIYMKIVLISLQSQSKK